MSFSIRNFLVGRYKKYRFKVVNISWPLVVAWRYGQDLECVQDNTRKIKKSDIIAFCTLRNEAFRIEYFLDYYRKHGVRHFLFVDNGSTDNFMEVVGGRDDCSVWHTTASYKDSDFGMRWLNHLLRKYGVGHWCLTVDPDEFLVFPHSESRSLNHLTGFLESERRENLFCLLLDMYSVHDVKETYCAPGQNPLEVCSYFDARGFTQRTQLWHGGTYVQGGVRRRVMFHDDPDRAPAVNKTPLIKWRWDYCYVSSTHVAVPRRLNRANSLLHASPTGCLLHFKFLSVLHEKADEEIKRGEHYDNSVEYKKYKQSLEEKLVFHHEKSVKYEGSQQLIDLGLMNNGQWF